MPDHPSWPAELVEKGARALAKARTGFAWGVINDQARSDFQREALAVLSALSGDLVPRSQAVVLTDDHEVCDAQLAEARSQADALAEALERLDRAVVEHDGYDSDDWHEHVPNDGCDDYCELMRAMREARDRLASYRSSSSTETEG